MRQDRQPEIEDVGAVVVNHELEIRKLKEELAALKARAEAADIALLAYTQVADEGGFDLARWPGVKAWIARGLALPGMVPIDRAA